MDLAGALVAITIPGRVQIGGKIVSYDAPMAGWIIQVEGLGAGLIGDDDYLRPWMTPTMLEEYLDGGKPVLEARANSMTFYRQCACACGAEERCRVRTVLSPSDTIIVHAAEQTECRCGPKKCPCTKT